MNFPPPEWAREGAEEALRSTMGNHYAHPKGIPRLREAIQKFYGTQFHGRELDTETEMVVTSGANEGQYAAFTAFVEPGDEVIIIEPFFDQYFQSVVFNGGVPVFVPLHPHQGEPGTLCKPTWTLDVDELRRAITPRTKMLVLNTPHNPVGKVFTRAELEAVAQLADAHDLLVMSDEVYERLVYDREHVRFATLPRMWDRTITVGSAGKLFAATGWRVGWLIGPPALIGPVFAASIRIVYCSNTVRTKSSSTRLTLANVYILYCTTSERFLRTNNVVFHLRIRRLLHLLLHRVQHEIEISFRADIAQPTGLEYRRLQSSEGPYPIVASVDGKLAPILTQRYLRLLNADLCEPSCTKQCRNEDGAVEEQTLRFGDGVH
ncbi:pyridoxal phosphate-dependent transferase [Fomitopsis serialis]|uniref:pyridoxal phosphate-dependent transferase n=1 Tax=Fomitopsis serialis TaxID=139415 RepID=UPI002007D736|nr:pyridoxal phosphate-dependent transferase [Neoantrodia serialis]KAH9934306.1 pyridoxal phosphate-dependent transferase [Neoantrodia serialis]